MSTYTLRESRELTEFELDVNYNRSVNRIFIITSDDQTEFGPILAYNTFIAISGIVPGVPYANSYGESDGLCYCDKINGKPIGLKRDGWILTAHYGPYNPNLINANPLERFPVAVYRTTKMRTITDIDTNGKIVTNSAGEPYDPPIERDDSRLILTIKRNESTFSAQYAAQFKDKLNSDVFAGWAAGAVKVSDITGTPAWSGFLGLYFEVEYEFEISNLDWGWQAKVLDAGYKELDGSGKLQPIYIKGEVASKPIPLDGFGHHLDPPPTTTGGIAGVFNTYDLYDKISFASTFAFTNVIGL